MSTTPMRHRIFAGMGAALFLLTASALTIAVVYDMVTGSGDKTAKKDTTTTQPTTDTTSTAGKLAGTQLSSFTPVASTTELQKIDTKVGDGTEVKTGDTVTVDYTGAVAATGKIFESSLDSGQTATFPLAKVIVGWQEGIPGMKIGGTRRLIIPAAKAYGANPPSAAIPANADLVFDVTLKSIGTK